MPTELSRLGKTRRKHGIRNRDLGNMKSNVLYHVEKWARVHGVWMWSGAN